MPMTPGRWLWSRPELKVPSSICLSFAAKPLPPQKMKLHRRETLSPRTAARHSSAGLAPEHCVFSCSLLTFSWSLTVIPTVVPYMAPQQLSSSRRWQWDLWHSENKNCLPWGPALNCKKIFGFNRLWIQLLDFILQLFLIFFSRGAHFLQEKSQHWLKVGLHTLTTIAGFFPGHGSAVSSRFVCSHFIESITLEKIVKIIKSNQMCLIKHVNTTVFLIIYPGETIWSLCQLLCWLHGNKDLYLHEEACW